MRARIKRSTETLTNGTRVVRQKLVAAPELEWRQQAAQVRALKAMPEYGRDFLLVGGMEAGRRGPREAVKAKATGLTAGHPDLTIFFRHGRAAFIENKAKNGRVSPVQKERHAALAKLGFDVVVIQSDAATEAASRAVDMVRAWLGRPVNGN